MYASCTNAKEPTQTKHLPRRMLVIYTGRQG